MALALSSTMAEGEESCDQVTKTEPCTIITIGQNIITHCWNPRIDWQITINKDIRKKTKDKLIEQYKGSIIVDTKLELKTKEKGATYISTPSEHYINATNVIWILKDNEEISTFQTFSQRLIS